MKQQLDTCTFLWFIAGDPLLSPLAKSRIEDANNINYLSIVSVWEIGLKYNKGKLELRERYSTAFIKNAIEKNNIVIRYITIDDVVRATNLPFPKSVNGKTHDDPFDRLIVAQALEDDVAVITCDSAFDLYDGLERIW